MNPGDLFDRDVLFFEYLPHYDFAYPLSVGIDDSPIPPPVSQTSHHTRNGKPKLHRPSSSAVPLKSILSPKDRGSHHAVHMTVTTPPGAIFAIHRNGEAWFHPLKPLTGTRHVHFAQIEPNKKKKKGI